MVSSSAKTVDAYLASLTPERREVISAMRSLVLKNLPKGYVEGMDYGMISYFVPLSRFPETYNGHALMYASLAAQKNFNSIYLMGVYGDETRAKRFKDGFVKAGKKLDAGKSCIRFKTLDDLALDAIAESIASMPVDEYVALYERSRLQTKAGAKKATVKKASSK